MNKLSVNISLAVLLLSNFIFSQWLLPPYKAETNPMPSGIMKIWAEADLNGDGKKELITLYQSSCANIPPELIIYTSNGKLIDAVNGESKNEFIEHTDFVFQRPGSKKEYYMFLVSSNFKISLKVLDIDKNGFPYARTLYSFRVGYKEARSDGKFLYMKEKNRLAVYINTEFPKRKGTRRLVLIDTKTLDVVWDKLFPDYVYQLFGRKNDDVFYFTTLAYSNGLFRANKTFYSFDNNIITIDTSLKNPTLLPDTTAPDYATDTCSYIVKISLKNGEELKRVKTGNSFFQTRGQKTFVDSVQNVVIFDRRNSLASLAYYSLTKDTLVRSRYLQNMKSLYGVYAPRINFTPEYLLESDSDNSKIYKIEKGIPELVKTVNTVVITPKRIKNSNLIFGFNYQNFESVIFDKDFNVLTKLNRNKLPSFQKVFWSDKFGGIFFASYIQTTQLVRLKKLPLYERFSPEFIRLIVWIILPVLFLMLFLWILTMIISAKRLKSKNKQLEEKNAEIKLATAKLIHSEKLALLGTVSASFAHQLNSPLGAIINSAERILKKGENKNAELIKRSAEYTKFLVRKFLETSRNNVENEKNCCDFNEILEDWLTLFGNEASKRQIEIVKDLKHKDEKIIFKKSELFEILTNLLFNARDSLLTCEKKEKIIYIKTYNEKENFVLEIEDTGKGFDEKIIIFATEPFKTTKPLGKGTGLGLWIVKKIVKNYNGRLELINTNNGALVRIKIKSTSECEKESGENEE